jgi:hypothetical protein
VVDADGVGTDVGHEGCVSVALGDIGEGVRGGALVCDAWEVLVEVEGEWDHVIWIPLMKNCWPSANSFAPLAEMVGIAVMVGERKLNVRRKSVKIDNMMTCIAWRPGDKSCTDSTAIEIRATEVKLGSKREQVDWR